MKKHKFLITFIMAAIISYILMYGFYLSMSVGLPYKTLFLQMRRYIPNAMVIGIVFSLWQQSKIPWKKISPHIVVFLAWAVVYPLSYWITFHQNTNFIDNHFDISFASYIFVFTTTLRLLLHTFSITTIQRRMSTLTISMLHTLLMVLPVLQIIYFVNYHSPITEAACMAMLQTNALEAHEYILQNVGYSGILMIIILFIILLFLFMWGNYVKIHTVKPIKKTILISVIILLASGIYSCQIFRETGIMDVLHNAQDYFDNAQKFNAYHKNNFNTLIVTPTTPEFSQPSTIIMVIGESASKDYCSAYGYSRHDTTPWLRTMSSQPGFILFKHAYTSWGQTVPALERALTEKNQYNNLDFNQCITMLDIAKKAGYTTYWISNQGTISNADTPITLVAKTADHSAWIEDELANSDHQRYDGDLLPYLKRIDPKENNFVVIHIMGSHDSYDNRYPRDFTKWPSETGRNSVTEYDNSIAYTDWFLEQVYMYGKDNLNLQAMLYFSDHGADPQHRRHPDYAPFEGLRIPMFLYLSPEYCKLYPITSSVLQNHADTYFTNDLMYELMCGVFHIKSNHYDETNSLSSTNYKYTRDMLTTELGKINLTEDINN
ncbi:phosphoethanolamine transferase [Megasphaera paucivorans]|uniref:Heptose-I-phosphate ethanolaminephosphotransferase n=1 Tax=Megasphaera paucivorans TaxID=349095 RepID=A0A1G9PWI3_9FIRM|nr:phosphoethanolamine transferase [Megasphaera paucivorans]SDM03023.1 heptose-I-phosphate ethanolaminephosphotransferase [Megasphaera paucivorans]